MTETAYKCPRCGSLLTAALMGKVPSPDPGMDVPTMLCHECGRVTPFSMWRMGGWEEAVQTSDSTELGGDMAGPTDVPYERFSVVLDTRRAVIIDHTDVAMMENGSDGRRVATVLLQGRVNQSTDRSRVLYLMDEDGLAAIVSQCIGLAVREGGAFEAEFRRLLDERMGQMP